MDIARRAVKLAKIDYVDLPAILTAEAAMQAESYVLPPVTVTRGNAEAGLASASHKLSGRFHVGGHQQF